ncbi:MAG TPA: flagellar biosynthesis anti-sigma factor FlgM [Burkholderiaceae bacterium]|nr:flagellar biosynthesis anti-sigma factor FlgM [Burkholderiaceae bacterium]
MKITRTSEPTRAERAQPSAGGAARASGAAAKPAAASSGRVQISDLSTRLNQLEKQFPDTSFDAKKVSEIQSAIADGRYQVNAGAVADKLLASAAQLTGRKA